MEAHSTKERIMDTAIVLFSEIGYDLVSMRDIAGKVGIKASSIYNHFPSKRDILLTIYDFYAREFRSVVPNLEILLQGLETESLQEVLTRTCYYWPPLLQDKMDRIIQIASQRIYLDKESEDFVSNYFFKPLIDIWVPLLTQGIESGRIKPINVDSFTKLIMYFAFCAAELNRTAMKITKEQWISGLGMLFSMLEPIKNKK